VYTGLLTLLLESFFATRTNELGDIKSILSQLPNEFSRDDVKREWFSSLVDKIRQANLYDDFRNWCLECGKTNATFRLWSFVTFSLLEPLIELYIAIRTSNFNARNAAVSRIAPLFFCTNHRNYARLCAQHLVDLKRASSYLFDRLARAFAVNRSNRPFSCRICH
jgi:hypothetical protein